MNGLYCRFKQIQLNQNDVILVGIMDIRVVSFRELPNNNFELEVSLLYA